jgi:pimeloyl-ACP methyl ester carboxylesterase
MTRSTTVDAATAFYRPTPGMRLSRLALRTTQRLWPSLAVRVAFRVFGTPLPPRWMRRAPQWGDGWQRQAWPFEDGGLTLYEPRREDDGSPVVLLVHGWGGQAHQLLALAQAIDQAGLRPVLVDLPAHGTSAGSTSNLPQFARAIEYVAARLQAQGRVLQAVVGHSLGANAAAYASARGMAAPRLVLLAPPASARDYTRFFAQVFGLWESTRAELQAHIEAREGVLMAHFEPPAVGPRIRAATLVVHDRHDRVNPFAHGEAFEREIWNAKLVATEGLGHRKLLADPAVVEEVVAFLRTA